MANYEKKVEKMVEELLSQQDPDTETYLSFDQLHNALTQLVKEVEAGERERIKNWAEVYGVYTLGNLREEGKAEACRQLIKNLTTPPTND